MFELVENRLFAYADDSTLLVVVRKPTDRPAVAASLNRKLPSIQEWCNHWCMILNPNKTMALVVSRSRTVSPSHGDLVLSGVSIRASPSLDILGVKFDSRFTFDDHVRGIVSRVSQRIVFFICSPNPWVLSCWMSPSAWAQMCIRWPGFVPIRVSCRCVIDVVWLGFLCCTRLIRTLISFCSVSFHLLLPELDKPLLRPRI